MSLTAGPWAATAAFVPRGQARDHRSAISTVPCADSRAPDSLGPSLGGGDEPARVRQPVEQARRHLADRLDQGQGSSAPPPALPSWPSGTNKHRSEAASAT